MAIRLSGLQSGLDTDSIISALVSSYSTKVSKYTKAQTKLSWTQSAWKDVNSKVYSLYSSISSLRYSSSYASKKTTVSDTSKATVTTTNSAINGTQTLKIKQLARAGYITGANLGSSTTEKTTLSDLGYTGGDGTIKLTVGGKDTEISVNGDTKISDLVSSLNDAGVKANYDSTNKRIFVSASDSGTSNDFSLVGSDANGISALSAFGLSVDSTANTAAYQSTAAYALNEDGEAYITYDEDGNAVTNGTYSEEKTKANILSIYSSLKSAYADKEAAETENTTLSSEISYAKAYSSVAALRNGENGDTIDELGKMLDVSSPSKSYVGEDGTIYTSMTEETDEDGNTTYTYKYTDEDGEEKTFTTDTALDTVSDRITQLAKDAGLITTTIETDEDGNETTTTDETAFKEFKANLSTISKYEASETNADAVSEIQDAYAAGTLDTLISEKEDTVASNEEIISNSESVISANSGLDIGDYSGYDDDALAELAASKAASVTTAAGVVDGSIDLGVSSGATRVNGQDAIIYLNDAEFTSSSNSITVNGITINALATTGDDEITITTDTDTQGLYDKIKDFLSQYNEVVNELCSLYNADSASGYSPLSDDEKEAMTDSQIEKWEEKIKASLLRRDSSLSGIITSMTNSMAKSYTVNGKSYSLASFGIKTLGYFNSAENENYAYHIDGDEDDTSTSSNTDKLMTALTEDPDSVIDFMKQLTSGLYDSLDKKMKSTSMSSAYTIYNDKEMASEYSDYTDLISTWEDRLEEMEDYYYSKFSSMESALTTLQSSSNSLSSLMG